MQGKIKLQPKVSVILTVYNREHVLRRCIRSLLNQSFKDWELIIVDDGSTDKSIDILKEYESNYENIKVIHQDNLKLPLSRNKGIKLSTGDFITFLDSDDEYSEDHLLCRVEFMDKYPEVDLIHGGVKIIGSEYVRDKNYPHNLIHLSQCTIGATFFGKRKVFIELNGFKNLSYSEDSEFLERAEKKYNIVKVEFNTYKYYRDNPDSITNMFMP